MAAGTNSIADWKPSTTLSNEQLQDVIGPMFDNTANAPITSVYDDTFNRVVISLDQSQINHDLLQNRGTNSHVQIDNHISSIANPHNTTKAQVGLGNVDNTSDLNKPISTATQIALNGKENTIAAGTITQYWRGDKSWQTLDKSAVGLGNVDNTSDLNKPISNLTQTALNGKENSFAAGTVSQYFRGDKTWQTLDKAVIGLSNVDNTSDLNKPISTATQTALNGKANLVHTHTSSDITNFTTAVQAIGDIRYAEIGHIHPNATSSIAGFMSPADKTKLDGLINAVLPKTVTVLNNTSSTVFTNITELQINCVAGNTYKFRYFLRHTSNAAATGITFSMNGTAAGALGAKAQISTSRTAASFPSINSFGGLMAVTGVPATSPEVTIIEGIFVCTANGTMYPQFRSELNGSQVQILDNSIMEYNEI